jgi:peptide-methionine (R)-S-oxide reductase
MADRVVKKQRRMETNPDTGQFHVTRRKGNREGFYRAIPQLQGQGHLQVRVLGKDLFSSTTKYESGTGWPSFWAPISKDSIKT